MHHKRNSLLAGCVLYFFMTGFLFYDSPENLGVKNGALRGCQGASYCVSTQDTDAARAAQPLSYSGAREEAMRKLTDIIKSMRGAKIVTGTPDYLHVTFRSMCWHALDDTEFFVDDTRKIIQFRSATRLWFTDFGANRKRMEEIRKRFQS